MGISVESIRNVVRETKGRVSLDLNLVDVVLVVGGMAAVLKIEDPSIKVLGIVAILAAMPSLRSE